MPPFDGEKESWAFYNKVKMEWYKMGKYKEAKNTALQATEVDSKWAKGWWRLGLACEMTKDFLAACKYYENALKLEKTNTVFRQHFDDVKKRLKMISELENGTSVMKQGAVEGKDYREVPHLKAFNAIRNDPRLAGIPLENLSASYAGMVRCENMEYPISQQYLREILRNAQMG